MSTLRDLDSPGIADHVLAAQGLEPARPPTIPEERFREVPAPAGVFRRLLVAFDGSAQAERALEEAIGLAWASKAHVTVIAVAPEPSGWGAIGGMDGFSAPIEVVEVNEQLERQYESLLRRAIGRIPPMIAATPLLRHGSPGPISPTRRGRVRTTSSLWVHAAVASSSRCCSAA